jgi:MFS family permease
MDITYHPEEPTVFGLPARQGRWLLIPLGVMVLLCLGTVYAWSIFRRPLEAEMGISATASLLPFTLVLVCNAVMMPITGFYMCRWGTRRVAAMGGAIVGLGYLLASLATQIETLTLAYGVVVGIGVGMTYGVPMAVVARWFPDRKGLAVGLTIIGFGLSPLVTAPLANTLIGDFGVRPTLRIMGIAFGLIILAISLTLKLPPKTGTPTTAPSPTPTKPATMATRPT